MKRLVLLSLLASLAVLGTEPSQGPFGLRRGMSKDEVVQAAGKVIKVDGDVIQLATVPRPHPDFDEYFTCISPSQGLLEILANGKTIDTSVYGTELQGEFEKIRDAISMTYGPPTQNFDFLRVGSIWNEPRDWMEGLIKKDRTLSAYWELKGLASRLKLIYLVAEPLSAGRGYLGLNYESEGWEEYVDRKQADKAKVF